MTSEVGAPDPELETSPIVGDDEEVDVEPELAEAACLFNGLAYPPGTCVPSGDELLRCERPGVWVREGEMRPRGPAHQVARLEPLTCIKG